MTLSLEGGELESDENRKLNKRTVPSEHTCREIASSIENAHAIDIDTVIRNELIISITDLDSHVDMVTAERHTKIINVASRNASLRVNTSGFYSRYYYQT